MIEALDKFDKELFLKLNQLHTPWLDPIMDWVSYSIVPVYLILIITVLFGLKYFGKKGLLIAFIALLNFGATDAISARLFKPYFERLRPCHSPELENLYHTVGKCWGGKFGFVSSHASNTFGIAIFLWLIFRKRNKWFSLFLPWATLVSYSRIYLAKHYPGDIIGGAILGGLCAFIFYLLWSRLVLGRHSDPSRQ